MNEYVLSAESGFASEPVNNNKRDLAKLFKNIALVIVILMLSFISYVGSKDGFMLLLERGDASQWAQIVAGMLSGAIVLFQLTSLASYAVSRQPLFLVAYLFLLLLSSTLGSSYFGRQLGFVGDAVNAEITSVFDDKMYEIRLFYNDLSSINTQMAQLRERSEYMVAEETKSKCWSRCEERKSDRDNIVMLAEQLNKQVDEIDDLIQQVQAANGDEDKAIKLKALADTAALFSSMDNKTLSDLSGYLDEVIDKYTVGRTASVEWLGEDPEMVRLARDMMSRIGDLRSVSREVQLPNTGASASLERSVGMIMKLFSGNIKSLTPNEWYSLGIALIVDLLILYASVMLKIINNVKTIAKSAMVESQFNLQLFSKVMRTSQLKTPMDLIRTVEGNLIRQRDGVMYLSPKQDTRCYTLMSTLEALNFVDKTYTNELEFKLRERLNLPANRYIFRLPVNTWQEIKKAGFQMVM